MALYIQLSTQNVFTKYLSISSITGGNSVNTEQLTSTVASLATNTVVPSFLSTQALFASSVTTSSLTTSSLTTESLTATSLLGSSLTTSSITANSVTSGVMSTLVLYASSIVGVTTGGGGIASIPSVLSTFAILTSSLQVSTVVANTLSTQQLFTSSLQGNNLVASNIFVSSGVLSTFSTNAVNFASGFGYLTMPDIYPNSVYTSTVTTSNLLVGTNSVISPIQFFGFGTYSNTVISELSTGGTTQELLFFRGSNASDRIRMQTTGSVVFEPGVSARIWPTAPSNVTPAMIINTSSNVGIQTATPGTALDVAGTGRFITLSTQALNISSINGQVYSAATAPTTSSLSLSTGFMVSPLQIGNFSTVNSVQFNGLFGNYNNTVLTEISTGAGTQELLLFKGSSVSDRVRVQTTGNFVVETGVNARLWNPNTVPTQSNATPAFIINSSSNVGIQTATPGAALDVAGTTRAVNLSSQQLFVSSVNGGLPIVNAVTNNAIVALTYNSNAFTYDGNQWLTGSSVGSQVHGLAFNGSLWVSGTEAGVYSSADGINWGATSFTGTPTSGVAWNGTIWVVGGWYGGMWFSYDGYTWTACPQAPSQAIQDIAWGKDKFIAACSGAVYYSYDGLYWYNLGNVLGGDQTYCVAYNGLIWLIGGRNAPVTTLAYSYDGIRWFNTTVTFQINDLAWSGRIWVAVTGTNQTVLSSPDGITWTQRTNANYTDLGGGYVTWNGSFFYTASGNSFIYLARSTDGITWRSLGTITGQQIRKIKARYVLPLNGAQQDAGIYSQNIFLGISTNQTVVRFPGVDGLYRNTLIGEISSFNTRFAEELILFKGSTPQDRIRLQTTGEIRFEAGVPARFYSSISSIAPLTIPTFLISTNSNVGIGTALPAATLDVAGTGRFLTLSTLELNISSINGQLISAIGGSSNPDSLTVSSLFTSSIFNHGTISTHSLVIYGASTLTVQGVSYFQNIVSTQTLITTSLGIVDSATGGTSYIETSNGSLIVNNLSTSELTISSLNIIDGNTGIINSLYVSSGFLNFNTSTLNGTTSQTPAVSGVTQIIAGTNVTISPVDGLGIVTINAAGGGGGGGGEPVPYLSSYSLSTGSLNVSSLTSYFLNASTMSQVNIAVQPSTSLWVAVGRDTVANNRIKFSYNGITWLSSLSGAFTTGGCNVAWDGKLWVAVGTDATANNRIKYSGDGMNWSNSLGASFSSGPRGIGTNGRMWVALGQDVTAPAADIKYSYNGITWSNGTGAVLNSGEAVAWNGKMWVACANAGVPNETLLYSYNGINWSTSVSGGFSLGGKGVAWNGRMWVTVGQDAVQNNMIKYSYDGITWSNSLGSGFSIAGNGVAWNGYRWVAVGDDAVQNNRIKYSSDGITWSNSLGTGFSISGFGIAWNGSMWVATGSDATQNNTIKYSYDGVTWSNSAGRGFTTAGKNGVAFNSNVVPSYNQTNFEIEPQNIPVFFRSTNQMSFTQSSIILNNTLFIDSLNKVGINTATPQTDLDVVGVGRFQTLSSIQLNTLEVSVSSITTNQLAVSSFTTLQTTVSSINQVNIIQSNPLWVAVGGDAVLAGNIKYSSDGFNWNNSLGSGFSVSGNDVAWNGRMWVAVGIDATAANTLKYSYDGANWLNSAGSGFSYSGNAVAWNGRLWVAVGTDAVQNNRIKYSGDGINWSNSGATAFGGVDGGYGIAWNGKLWVAVGGDTIANNRIKYSYDGINWSNSLGASFTSNAYGAAWNGRMWVAAGQDTTPANTLKYSYDGITWFNSLGNGFTTRGRRVAWNGQLWVATGANTLSNTVRYSGDGINWSNSLGAAISGSATGVAWNGRMWIVLGFSVIRNINYSYDGVTWITQGAVFSASASGIAFNSNVVPSYNQTNFEIEPQNIPIFLRSTNQISFTRSTIILNNSMFIDGTNKVGINTGSPQTDLDVNGSGRFQTVSTLNINVSTILGNQIRFQRAYLSNVLIGTQSTVNSAQYNGLFGNYNNTVLAEISTGGGLQELLVFKGSSVSDRVRVQTTGDVIFETGVSARLWSDTTVPTLSNTTPAMIINSSSNVGIQTAIPGATLDVAGTGRFITASSISMYTGALYTGVYFI